MHPIITGIVDIPDDQGNKVYLTFSKAYYDDQVLPRETEGYTIERYDLIYQMMIQSGVNITSGFVWRSKLYL